MSGHDAYQDDMGRFSSLSDRELDGLLTGQVPADDEDLTDVAAFVRDLGRVFEESPAEETAARHLAALTSEARLLVESDKSTAMSAPSSTAVRERPPRPKSRRTMVKRHPLSSLPVRLAAGTALMLLLSAFGGAAVAGALPGPLQGTVAGLARNVGVSLPGDAQNDADQPQGIAGQAGVGGSPLTNVGVPQQSSVSLSQVRFGEAAQGNVAQGNASSAQNAAEDADPVTTGGGAQDDAEDTDEPASGAATQDDAEDADDGAAGAGAADDAEDADDGAAGVGAEDDAEDADDGAAGAGAEDDAEDADDGAQEGAEGVDEGSTGAGAQEEAEDADEGGSGGGTQGETEDADD